MACNVLGGELEREFAGGVGKRLAVEPGLSIVVEIALKQHDLDGIVSVLWKYRTSRLFDLAAEPGGELVVPQFVDDGQNGAQFVRLRQDIEVQKVPARVLFAQVKVISGIGPRLEPCPSPIMTWYLM
jgi:hypothetical protein